MSTATPPSATYAELVTTLADLIAPLHDIHRQKIATLAPIVQRLIRSHSRAAREIEHTLDHLLDCACIPEGLALFKALCRYYYPINPAATASYVHAYRDLWDSEKSEEDKEDDA